MWWLLVRTLIFKSVGDLIWTLIRFLVNKLFRLERTELNIELKNYNEHREGINAEGLWLYFSASLIIHNRRSANQAEQIPFENYENNIRTINPTQHFAFFFCSEQTSVNNKAIWEETMIACEWSSNEIIYVANENSNQIFDKIGV